MSKKIPNVKKAVEEKLDVNKDGQIDIQDIINLALRTPGVHINREAFLRKELYKNHSEEEIEDAINRTPALAGISPEEIDKIADEVISFERTCVSGVTVALGTPGSFAMVATIPADIIQYYGYTIRAAQKLLYLYGFPELKVADRGLELDSETINQLIICLGIMNGVAGANNAMKSLAKAFSTGVEKKLINTALTKGTLYPLIKNIMKWFGVQLTKKMLAETVKKGIGVVGGVIGGGITFATFKPCCYRLKKVLEDTKLSNPNHKDTKEEEDFFSNIVDGEVIEVDDFIVE